MQTWRCLRSESSSVNFKPSQLQLLLWNNWLHGLQVTSSRGIYFFKNIFSSYFQYNIFFFYSTFYLKSPFTNQTFKNKTCFIGYLILDISNIKFQTLVHYNGKPWFLATQTNSFIYMKDFWFALLCKFSSNRSNSTRESKQFRERKYQIKCDTSNFNKSFPRSVLFLLIEVLEEFLEKYPCTFLLFLSCNILPTFMWLSLAKTNVLRNMLRINIFTCCSYAVLTAEKQK